MISFVSVHLHSSQPTGDGSPINLIEDSSDRSKTAFLRQNNPASLSSAVQWPSQKDCVCGTPRAHHHYESDVLDPTRIGASDQRSLRESRKHIAVNIDVVNSGLAGIPKTATKHPPMRIRSNTKTFLHLRETSYRPRGSAEGIRNPMQLPTNRKPPDCLDPLSTCIDLIE